MDRLPTPVFLGFPGGSAGKEAICNAGRLLRVPWTAMRSNQLILKEISIEYSLDINEYDAKAEAPIFWPPDVKSQLTGKDPDAGKD